MSTFYYLACPDCKKRQDFVGRWVRGVEWLCDSPDDIVEFMQNHIHCSPPVKIVSEHDSEARFENENSEKRKQNTGEQK